MCSAKPRGQNCVISTGKDLLNKKGTKQEQNVLVYWRKWQSTSKCKYAWGELEFRNGEVIRGEIWAIHFIEIQQQSLKIFFYKSLEIGSVIYHLITLVSNIPFSEHLKQE